jgi:hypothetical protein
MLVYSPSGYGKTEFTAGAPNPFHAGCEPGEGGGLLTIAAKNLPYVVPETYAELERFCSGNIEGQKEFDTYVLDGMSYATDTTIKDYALTVQRTTGNSGKRAMGIPELDDYGTMAELERRLLSKLLMQPKNIIVTCLQDYYQPFQAAAGSQSARQERIGGPDLPGMMRLGSAAMFDIVMRLEIKPVLTDPRNANSRVLQRFWQTEGSDKYLAKSRIRNGSKNAFPSEVKFDLETGEGTFGWFLAKAQETLEVAK